MIDYKKLSGAEKSVNKACTNAFKNRVARPVREK